MKTKIQEALALVDIDDESGEITTVIDIDILQNLSGLLPQESEITVEPENNLQNSLDNFNSVIYQDNIIDDDIEEGSEKPVQDGDNDGKGYTYDADVYNMFGDENQQMKYVPARFADNPLKDPVVEHKSLFDYLNDIDNKRK